MVKTAGSTPAPNIRNVRTQKIPSGILYTTIIPLLKIYRFSFECDCYIFVAMIASMIATMIANIANIATITTMENKPN